MEELIRVLIPELLKIYNINLDIKILFHCRAGVSRSATLAIAFLCVSKNYRLSDSYYLVKSKRSIINPNKGFKNCLIKLFDY
jgi:protein-tyrosine phosphatase